MMDITYLKSYLKDYLDDVITPYVNAELSSDEDEEEEPIKLSLHDIVKGKNQHRFHIFIDIQPNYRGSILKKIESDISIFLRMFEIFNPWIHWNKRPQIGHDGNLESIEGIKVLKEHKSPILTVKRRFELIDDKINFLLQNVYAPDKICIYRSGEELFLNITESVVENMYMDDFDYLENQSEEWREIYDSIVGYMQYKYEKKIEEYFHANCGD